MATHSSVLAWKIPGTGHPGGLPSMGCTEADTTEVTQQQQLIFTIELILLTLNPSLAQPFSPPVSLVTWATPDVRV